MAKSKRWYAMTPQDILSGAIEVNRPLKELLAADETSVELATYAAGALKAVDSEFAVNPYVAGLFILGAVQNRHIDMCLLIRLREVGTL
jgi:hypothetical protein